MKLEVGFEAHNEQFNFPAARSAAEHTFSQICISTLINSGRWGTLESEAGFLVMYNNSHHN